MSRLHAIALVARREIGERLHSRAFLISTLLMLGLVGGSTALGRVLNSDKTYRVAVTAPAPPGLDAALRRAARPFDARVRLRVVGSAAAGRQELTA